MEKIEKSTSKKLIWENRKDNLIIFNAEGETIYEASPDQLTSMIVWEKEKKRRSQIKRISSKFNERHGERITVLQFAMNKANKELNNIELRVFIYLLGNVDFENFLEVSQSKIAKELETDRSYVNKAIKVLKEKEFIEIIKNSGKNYYRINPYLAWKGQLETWQKTIDFYDYKKKEEKAQEKSLKIAEEMGKFNIEE